MAPDLTVAQNLRLTGADIDACRAQLAEMDLDALDLDEQVRDVPLPFLRMLDLARALSFDPQLLLLDEITAALPPDLSARASSRSRGGGRNATARCCSSPTVWPRSVSTATCAPCCAMVATSPRSCPVREGNRRSSRRCSARLRRVVREEARVRSATAAAIGERPILEAEHIGAGRLLDDVSLSVRAGEVLGLVALEGQGQDTLFELLAGDRRPDRGHLLVDGRPVKARHPFDVIRRGVVLVPADRLHALLPQRSVRENIAAPLYNRVAAWGPINGRQERRRVAEAVDRLSIDIRAASQVRRLSGGNQQKVTIARWLARGLRVMLLFDPTRGIDVGTKHQVYDLVRALADEGAAIIMFTSELREVALVCDRSAVLHNGRIVAELPPDAGENALLTAAHGLQEVRMTMTMRETARRAFEGARPSCPSRRAASRGSPAAKDGRSASPRCSSCCSSGGCRNSPSSATSRSARSRPARWRWPSWPWPRRWSSSRAASTCRSAR